MSTSKSQHIPGSGVSAQSLESRQRQRLLLLLVSIGGIALGLWLSIRVEVTTTKQYGVQPSDSLASLASDLEVAREYLIAWNEVRYPAIVESRLQQGWQLTVHRQKTVPRWRAAK